MNWTCPFCFFSNRYKNDICGGKGRLGCNRARPSIEWNCPKCNALNLPRNQICRTCKQPKLASASHQSRPNAIGSRWRCKTCHWVNRSTNMRCGGEGLIRNPGCGGWKDDVIDKTFRDDKWLCSCGFSNRPENDLCGGMSDSLGCKAARPAPWICGKCGNHNDSKNMVCGGLTKAGCKSLRMKFGLDLKPMAPRENSIGLTATQRKPKRKFQEIDHDKIVLIHPIKRKKIKTETSGHWTKEWGL